jgi:hypothetical protein
MRTSPGLQKPKSPLPKKLPMHSSNVLPVGKAKSKGKGKGHHHNTFQKQPADSRQAQSNTKKLNLLGKVRPRSKDCGSAGSQKREKQKIGTAPA